MGANVSLDRIICCLLFRSNFAPVRIKDYQFVNDNFTCEVVTCLTGTVLLEDGAAYSRLIV